MTKKIAFTKMHWIWNDFIVLDQSDLDKNNILLNEDLVKKMCHRNFWIGSDGLLLVCKWEKTEFKYRMYNPDWSEAEMCWNGIRCYMKYLLDNSLTEKTNLDVETWVWILNLDIQWDEVTVDMWAPMLINELSFSHDKIWDKFKINSCDREFDFVPVSMWNPHCVCYIEDDLSNFDLNKYWKRIESNTEVFPKKVNVEFIKLKSETEINMRVYERGAWETLACWTWACASVVAGVSLWLLGKDEFITVNLAGWILKIKWSGIKWDSVIMKWEAKTSFTWEYIINNN